MGQSSSAVRPPVARALTGAAAGVIVGWVALGPAASPAAANPTVRNAFTARYPNSTLLAQAQAATGSTCYACHQPPSTSTTGNCYRMAVRERIRAGLSAANAIIAVEGLDSDGDGVPNGVEITTPRADFPGQVGYNPGLIGATGTDPCATASSTPVTNRPETPPPPPPPPCPADIAGLGGVSGPDGALTADDVVLFLASFFAGNTAVADLAGLGGTATLDGLLTPDDVVSFLASFFAGCP